MIKTCIGTELWSNSMLLIEKLREAAVHCTWIEVVKLIFLWTISHTKVRFMSYQKCLESCWFQEAWRMSTSCWFGKCTCCYCNFLTSGSSHFPKFCLIQFQHCQTTSPFAALMTACVSKECSILKHTPAHRGFLSVITHAVTQMNGNDHNDMLLDTFKL